MSAEETTLATAEETTLSQPVAPFDSDYKAEPISYKKSPKIEVDQDEPPRCAGGADQPEYGSNGTANADQRPSEGVPGGVTAFQFDASSMTLSIQNNIAAELNELKAELEMIPHHLPYTKRAVEKEIDLLQSGSEPEYLDVDSASQPIRLMRKVLVPVQRNPKFNFVGKLLGPGGKTLQGLIHQTKCRIYVLGRGSSREKSKEEELIASGDPKYSHLKDPLHVRVEVVAPAPIAYQRMAHALNELHYYLQPIRDDIVQSQLAEMASYAQSGMGSRGRGRMSSPGMRGMMRGAMPMRGRGMGPHAMGPPVHAQPPPPPGQQATSSPAAAYSGYQSQSGYAPYQSSVSSYGGVAASLSNTMASATPTTPSNVSNQPPTMPGTPMPSSGGYPAAYNYAYPAYQYGGYGSTSAQGQMSSGAASGGGKIPPEKRRATALNMTPY